MRNGYKINLETNTFVGENETYQGPIYALDSFFIYIIINISFHQSSGHILRDGWWFDMRRFSVILRGRSCIYIK